MGQFLDYIASVFISSKQQVESSKEKTSGSSGLINLADSSFAHAFSSKNSDSDKAAKIAALKSSNKKTIYFFQSIAALTYIVHLSVVTVPKIRSETFDLLEPSGWQPVTLNLVPLFVYLASLNAMYKIDKPISEGTKLTSKNSGLNLNENEFIHSLKIIVLLVAVCQISALFNEQLIWSIVIIVSLWCYLLTSRLAQSEYKRYAPSPKKQWVKLNMSRSPKPATPYKQPTEVTTKQDNGQTKATPRTRTKRAVKNIITGVSDKYHAFEQNVAHQLSQKIFTPMSPKVKMIE